MVCPGDSVDAVVTANTVNYEDCVFAVNTTPSTSVQPVHVDADLAHSQTSKGSHMLTSTSDKGPGTPIKLRRVNTGVL